jgi:SAM-dependent methyltransferase
VTDDLRRKWDTYYQENYAGLGSGWGSTVNSTVHYRRVIESFLDQNRPRRVLDLGCGDWQSSQFIPWDGYGVLYVGVDASPMIIERNRQRFASPSKHFYPVCQPTELAALGMRFDLVICKDVLQHMPNAMVNGYLDVVGQIAKVALITNDAYPAHELNTDIEAGAWRAIDIRKPPFSRTSFVISEYANFDDKLYWIKQVHLLPSAAPQS